MVYACAREAAAADAARAAAPDRAAMPPAMVSLGARMVLIAAGLARAYAAHAQNPNGEAVLDPNPCTYSTAVSYPNCYLSFLRNHLKSPMSHSLCTRRRHTSCETETQCLARWRRYG